MLKVGIVGATGYTGAELIRLLCQHPEAELEVVTSNSEKGKRVDDVFPCFRSQTDLRFEEHDSKKLKSCDLVFFATPHATAMHYVSELVDSGCKVIDLSADFRIKDVALWEKWYKEKHTNPELVEQAVYGLPEINREAIKQASLVANPGCYPTAVSLALIPALKNGLIENKNIIADVKSGVSGAGRKSALVTQFSEVSESFKAYNVSGHRHQPEIVEIISNISQQKVGLSFVPHLVPMNRGILATVYVQRKDHTNDIQDYYTQYYRDEPFVDVLPRASHPETRNVRMTNNCQLAIHQFEDGNGPTIILSVIDNLIKGASGQAVQNMNLMFGFDERLGLNAGTGAIC